MGVFGYSRGQSSGMNSSQIPESASASGAASAPASAGPLSMPESAGPPPSQPTARESRAKRSARVQAM